MDAAELIPNGIVRIIIWLRTIPKRILSRVILRRDHRSVCPRPENYLEFLTDARCIGLDDRELLSLHASSAALRTLSKLKSVISVSAFDMLS